MKEINWCLGGSLATRTHDLQALFVSCCDLGLIFIAGRKFSDSLLEGEYSDFCHNSSHLGQNFISLCTSKWHLSSHKLGRFGPCLYMPKCAWVG